MKIDNQILNILDNCTVNGCVVFLPPSQLDRKTYEAVNKCLENIGGKWNRKAKGHVFSEDPAELFDNLIITGETVDLKKQFQYFPTPEELARKIVDMAEIKSGDVLLEPSAGQGAIVDHFPRENTKLLIELNANNAKVLTDKGYSVVTTDFLEFNEVIADKIVMNPPFTKQQDISHILHAFDILKPGGILVSIVSEGPFFRENKKSVAFREFLEQNDAEVIENDRDVFKESGTTVKTRIVKIVKGVD
jgi:hypothetical protein